MMLIILFGFISFVSAQNMCNGVPDGSLIEWSCRYFTFCQNGRAVETDCSLTGQVFNYDIRGCANPDVTVEPCGSQRDTVCGYNGDGYYADWSTQCLVYFSCLDNQIVGINDCPAEEVFDEVACACDLKTNVYPPCGNKPYDENMPLLRGCTMWNVGANNNYFGDYIGEYNSGSGDGSGDSSGDGSGNGSGLDLDFSIIFGRKWSF